VIAVGHGWPSGSEPEAAVPEFQASKACRTGGRPAQPVGFVREGESDGDGRKGPAADKIRQGRHYCCYLVLAPTSATSVRRVPDFVLRRIGSSVFGGDQIFCGLARCQVATRPLAQVRNIIPSHANKLAKGPLCMILVMGRLWRHDILGELSAIFLRKENVRLTN